MGSLILLRPVKNTITAAWSGKKNLLRFTCMSNKGLIEICLKNYLNKWFY
jgi:hypothetical protein